MRIEQFLHRIALRLSWRNWDQSIKNAVNVIRLTIALTGAGPDVPCKITKYHIFTGKRGRRGAAVEEQSSRHNLTVSGANFRKLEVRLSIAFTN